jgi:hypothetical protein
MTEVERSSIIEDINKLREMKNTLPAGSKERQAIAEEIVKLCQVVNENDKLANEFFLRSEQNEIQDKKNEKDSEMLAVKADEEKKDKRWSRGIQIAGLGVFLIDLGVKVYEWHRTMRFEETGTITSNTGRNLMGRLFKDRNVPKV